MDDQVVFKTPWFELVATHPAGYSQPHYSIRTQDYVMIVATTAEGRLLLVRQFRPAVGRMTLELPSGHVEDGETPEHAARRELLEETGHVAEAFNFLGNLSPDTGRLANRMWCFFAADARPTDDAGFQPEPGIQRVIFKGSVSNLIAAREFDSALNIAALFHAVLLGHLSIQPGKSVPTADEPLTRLRLC
jgi:ADP-ribose pyrophosphatase